MSVIDFPAAKIPSFADLTRNHDRDRAVIVIEALIGGLKEEGVPRAIIIRALFDYVVHELGTTPEGGEIPSLVEGAENTAILNEIDAYWQGIRRQFLAADPDYFKTPE